MSLLHDYVADLFRGDFTDPEAVLYTLDRLPGGSLERSEFILEWIEIACDGHAFWQVVMQAWPGLDSIPHQRYADWFGEFERNRPRVIGLPRRMTVYRGQEADAALGLSWTRNRAVAEAFARGHRGTLNPTPIVWQTVITPGKVAFLCDDRQEEEVVLRAIPDPSGMIRHELSVGLACTG